MATKPSRYPSVSAGGGKTFLQGGRFEAGVQGRGDLVGLGPTYTFASPVFGGQAAVSLLGVGGRMSESKPQGSGLEAGDIILADELEVLTERAAMILDRSPERRVRRVVDDDNAFELRIVEPGHRIAFGGPC